jgi:ABC-2 type transport system ATP-binding protein
MILQAENLAKHYGDTVALRRLDLSVDQGEVFCLLGANGAGKTTTIQLFLGFIEPTSGSARIKGMEVKDHVLETKRYLAYIPENVMLYPNLTGVENLEYFTTLAGVDTDPGKLRTILSESGLPDVAADRYVGTYSKGMRQKVGIAMAVARKAELLLLDEPTSGLDPKASNEFSQLVTRLRDEGVAVLMATHDLFRSREIATRIGIMKHGELVAQVNASDVTHNDLERIYLEHMHD